VLSTWATRWATTRVAPTGVRRGQPCRGRSCACPVRMLKPYRKGTYQSHDQSSRISGNQPQRNLSTHSNTSNHTNNQPRRNTLTTRRLPHTRPAAPSPVPYHNTSKVTTDNANHTRSKRPAPPNQRPMTRPPQPLQVPKSLLYPTPMPIPHRRRFTRRQVSQRLPLRRAVYQHLTVAAHLHQRVRPHLPNVGKQLRRIQAPIGKHQHLHPRRKGGRKRTQQLLPDGVPLLLVPRQHAPRHRNGAFFVKHTDGQDYPAVADGGRVHRQEHGWARPVGGYPAQQPCEAGVDSEAAFEGVFWGVPSFEAFADGVDVALAQGSKEQADEGQGSGCVQVGYRSTKSTLIRGRDGAQEAVPHPNHARDLGARHAAATQTHQTDHPRCQHRQAGRLRHHLQSEQYGVVACVA